MSRSSTKSGRTSAVGGDIVLERWSSSHGELYVIFIYLISVITHGEAGTLELSLTSCNMVVDE